MASKALASPLVRHIATRGYAQAAPAAVKKDVRVSAGSRYEPQTDLGVSHILRSAAGLSTNGASGFIIARKLAQIGASVSASGDREFIYYTLEVRAVDLLHKAAFRRGLGNSLFISPKRIGKRVEGRQAAGCKSLSHVKSDTVSFS
ncbi:Ubiquinol-cytochrome c reductase core protein II [Operophtera brumata]|uniref:Ubiquinol-cytochrome c reductase core protein II n=1 Tax=Operophtera brumata TaxID=104452 RepID=A0A0L7LDN1_OPEBR|nr:Ubiquinol-cytochrome c reductase core protein II [Operophtera brumata]